MTTAPHVPEAAFGNTDPATREAFEAWFTSIYDAGYLRPMEAGCYLGRDAGMAWDAWQAAVQRALAARECAVSLALEVLRDNNRWHIDYDEHGGYDDSELQSRNLAAIHALEQIGAAPQQAAPAQSPTKAERVTALVNAGPFPGMSEAFDAHMGAACWTDPAYRQDAAMWAAAWKAAQPAAPAPDMRDCHTCLYAGLTGTRPECSPCIDDWQANKGWTGWTASAALSAKQQDELRQSADLTRAKALLVKLWDKFPETRPMIEGHTGTWFAWGVDRNQQAPAAEAVQPKAVRLTPEEMDAAWDEWFGAVGFQTQPGQATRRAFASAIERAVWAANGLRGE